ncbi:hypothetical protein [Burkholderia ubonensis]|uniref:hypothetical protein n=1 Tax=Burkholderia ubonensis TaxID=101571 RepID=UPI0012F79905|nr:hypothetical protein [Burkholderia ubonensis]
MRELNHRDISVISGGVFIQGGIGGSNVAGRNAIGTCIAIGNGSSITINGKRIEPNSIPHDKNASIVISHGPINNAQTSYASPFSADRFRNFFKYF